MRDVKIKRLFGFIYCNKYLLLALTVLLNTLIPNTVAGQNDITLTIVGSVETPDDANGVYVSGNYAYVAAGGPGSCMSAAAMHTW